MKTEDHPLSALIVKEDGLIYVNRVPEHPSWCNKNACIHSEDSTNGPPCEECRSAFNQYESALASAKESAVLCADQEQAQQLLWHRYPLTVIRDGKWDVAPGIYPIPDLKWEVIKRPIGFSQWDFEQVAILHSPLTEKEVDLLDKFMDEEIAYLKSCNPVDRWGRLENSFAAGMIHAYERIKAEREYIALKTRKP